MLLDYLVSSNNVKVSLANSRGRAREILEVANCNKIASTILFRLVRHKKRPSF